MRIRHQHCVPARTAEPDLFTAAVGVGSSPEVAKPDTPPGGRAALAQRYAAWRATELGADVFHQVERIARDQQAAGNHRVSVNQIFEAVRAARRVSCNNDFRAPLARELIDRHPELKDVIEIRERHEAP